MKKNSAIDAIVVGAGPNGLAAAITLQSSGLQVLLVEEKEFIGGGLSSSALTIPGFIHDRCSSVFPLAINSAFFQSIPFEDYDTGFVNPPAFIAHPFPDGSAVVLYPSIEKTVLQLDEDDKIYRDLIEPLHENWESIRNTFLAPPHLPEKLLSVMSFASKAILPATSLAKKFRTEKMRSVWAGMAAHSMLPLDKLATSGFGLMMILMGHEKGWPVAKGGAQALANAMGKHFTTLGGEIQTGTKVESLRQLPKSKAVLLDLGPSEVLRIAGDQLQATFRRQLKGYHYGMGVFKVDWALSQPIPFLNKQCLESATIHIGHDLSKIVESEHAAWNGKLADKPFIILTQPSLFDKRAPEKNHTAWAYCHTPNGYPGNAASLIEQQIEIIAPGFKDCIKARFETGPADLEQYNPNYVGGDINGGSQGLLQHFARPVMGWAPYKSSIPNVYLCSSSTPPGGGVHGLCGCYAAKATLRNTFHMV
jgi:phytoene dehydrogenase-like protein